MSAPRPPRTPRWVAWALDRLLPPGERGVVLAELAELHAHWAERRGRWEADRRYLRQLRRYPLHLVADRIRSVAAGPLPGAGDVRQAARSLLRSPGLAATIVLTVGLGIGSCTAMFAVVDTLYLRALPYPDAGRIQLVDSREGSNRWALSAVDVLAMQEQVTAFSSVGAYARATRTFSTGAGAAERITAWTVSPAFFHVLGIRPLAGRLPTEAESRPGAPPTAVVPLAFARDRLGARSPDGSDVVGRTIRLDGEPHEVVGVLPADHGPMARSAQVFVTLQIEPPTRKGPFFLFAVARLADGVTPGAARDQLHAVTRRLFPLWRSSFQDEDATWGMEPLATALQGSAGRLVGILLGAGALVLLIATANAAGLLLARVDGRATELAVRSAMGASRGRVMAHLLTESGLLAGAGALVGVAIARGGIAVLPAVASAYLPRLDELALSGPVLAFAALAAAASGLTFGLVPALRWGAAASLPGELRAAGRGGVGGRGRLQRGLVVAQLAVSVPLLAGAGLLVASFARLQALDPGFHTEHVVSMRLSLPSAAYPDEAARAAFWAHALPRIRAIPGVASAGLSDGRPPADHPQDNNFDLEDRPAGTGGQPVVPWIAADSGFFRTLGIPLLEGRLFDAHDAGSADPVLIVDRAWARRFFPEGDALGRRLRSGGSTTGPWTTVVGVVGDVPWAGLGEPDGGVAYFPDVASFAWQPYVYLRTQGDPAPAVAAVRSLVRGLDPGIPVTDVATADEALQASLARPRNLTLVVGAFSAVALALAALGLYGLMAYSVQRRRGDIAVRLTLGGTPRAVLVMVTRDGMLLALGGLALGLAASLALTRVLAGVLYGVGPRDPLALAGASLVLLTVAALGCLGPGLRAVRTDPAASLREE